MGILLRCTGGPCAGETFTVASELVLGREAPDPGRLGGDSRLSRRHARVFIDDGGRAVVEDLGSSNGTWINEERLTAPRICARGDVLRVGQTTFEVDVPAVQAATRVDTAASAGAPTIAKTPPPPPRLRVVAGPKEGEEITLPEELLIGRGYGEPGALGGDRRLSRRHARIARGPGGVFFIEDTGSSNGTTINGVRVRRVHSIKDGDEIAVGSSRLEVHGLPGAPLAAELEEELPATRAAVRSQAAPASAAWLGQAQPAVAPAAAGAHSGRQFVPQGAAGARLSSRRVTGVFVAVFAAGAMVAVGAVLLAAPLGSSACARGFICHKPPTAPPLRALATFTGSLGWKVEYDPQLAAPSNADAAGNQLTLHETSISDQTLGATPGSDAVDIFIRGYPSSHVSAKAAMQSMIDTVDSALVGPTAAPNSDQMFGIPVLGFHTATGEVLEGDARTPQGPGGLVKVAVLAASSGKVTVVAAAAYAVRQGSSQGTNPDEPFDRFADQVLETIRFPSDGFT
jgi:pSer/pThr/pTyr-binding forkhead associated (FHA) protein